MKDLKIEFMKNEIAKYSTIGVGGLFLIIYINFEIRFCFYKHLNLKSVYYYDIQHKCAHKGKIYHFLYGVAHLFFTLSYEGWLKWLKLAVEEIDKVLGYAYRNGPFIFPVQISRMI